MERVRAIPVIGRFVSCGLLSLTMSLAWRLTAAPNQVGMGSAFIEVLILLLGFVLGGLAWYSYDVRKQSRAGGENEILGFSLVVFVLMPLATILLLGLVWLLVLFVS